MFCLWNVAMNSLPIPNLTEITTGSHGPSVESPGKQLLSPWKVSLYSRLYLCWDNPLNEAL